MNIVPHTSRQVNLVELEQALGDLQYIKTGKRTVFPSPFADILAKLTRERVGDQWRPLNYVWSKYETGLKYSREGKLNNAELIFREADSLRKELNQTYLIDRLVDVGSLPAIAYLQYKKGMYDEAESSLVASLNSDATLLKEGLFILDYHRIQQLHNLARLYFKQGRLREGAHMIHKALRFMLCGEKLIVMGNDGLAITKEYVPANLRSDMVYQLVSETVNIFVAYPELNAELCNLAFSNLTAWEPKTQEEGFQLQFFRLQQECFNGNVGTFIKGSQPFLSTLPMHFDNYKLSVLVNIIDCVTILGGYTGSIKQAIDSFVGKMYIREQLKNACLTYFQLKL